MREIIRADHVFERHELSADEARERFADQPYKLELIDGLEAGSLDPDGRPIDEGRELVLSFYRHDTFEDLCAGPHVARSGELCPDAIKLLSSAGAHWRGDERRPMLQRIYATAFESRADMDTHLARLEEAAKRDHRRLGRDLELFLLEDHAPGMPYWLPNGLRLLNALIAFWREEHENRGYQEISTPLIYDKKLWETSGHWEHYRDSMFLIPQGERWFGVKPMNCPGAMVVFNHKQRSYRELPLRLSDCDVLHRKERSGTLHGLLRVQKFQQDDAHIFVTRDQVEAEIARILELTNTCYAIFELSYSFRVGTRPEHYMGDLESWHEAEAALFRVLDERGARYAVEAGDGAFYGPKIDILMEDSLGREWQMGTIQLDFQIPRRFGCEYVDADGGRKNPVVIHHVIYGSFERFLGILIEHFAGALPLWLAPVQVVLLPVSDRHAPHAASLADACRSVGARADVDASRGRISARVRAAWQRKIPYLLVVGDRELEAGSVSVRRRGESETRSCSWDAFIHELTTGIESRAVALPDPERSSR